MPALEARHGLPTQALAYAVELNWSVFPLWWVEAGRCACGNPNCGKNAGKHPLGTVARHGARDASTDPNLIRSWWRRYPRANVGLACGGSFWALDVDTQAGLDVLAEHEDRHGWLEVGPASRTGSGWQHQLYAPDGRLGNVVKPVPGLDVRTAGGFVVAPPSRHLSGGTYTWMMDRAPWSVALPIAPEWLIGLLTKPKPQPAPRTPRRPLRIGTRYLEVAVTAELARVASAGEGQRNSTLFTAAASLGRFVADGAIHAVDLGPALADAAMAAGLSATEVERTIKSGFGAAVRGRA